MNLIEKFGSDDKCRTYLEQLRFPNGVNCIRCQSPKISRIIKRNQFVCDTCDYQFSVLTNTIFHDTHLPLTKWFCAVYLMCESKKGISANQLKRTLHVAYKTAWYLCHRIRKALETDPADKLSGTIEVDETFIGGKVSNMHAEKAYRVKQQYGYHGKKSTVAGAISRSGKIRLQHIPDASRKSLHTFVRDLLAADAENLYTDEHRGYAGINLLGVKHSKVNHSEKQYVIGDVHTNSIESAFSLFKRSIAGAFHHISEKHLDKYLDEFEFRFSNRDNPYLFRDTLLRLLASDNIEYKELIKNVD